MNSRKGHILRIVLGVYMDYIGVRLAMLTIRERPANQIFMGVFAAVCILTGAYAAVYSVDRLFHLQLRLRLEEGFRSLKRVIGEKRAEWIAAREAAEEARKEAEAARREEEAARKEAEAAQKEAEAVQKKSEAVQNSETAQKKAEVSRKEEKNASEKKSGQDSSDRKIRSFAEAAEKKAEKKNHVLSSDSTNLSGKQGNVYQMSRKTLEPAEKKEEPKKEERKNDSPEKEEKETKRLFAGNESEKVVEWVRPTDGPDDSENDFEEK